MSERKFGRLQMEHRSEFQFRLLELNLIVMGALASVAFSSPRFWDSLLLIPALSFMFFLFWVHHGFVIRLTNWEPPAPMTFWQCLRCGTFTLGILSSFVGLPIAAVLLHSRGSDRIPTAGFQIFGRYGFPVVTVALYLCWFCLQYVLKKPPKGVEAAEPDGPANGSQPIRSETNRTSSAAGSRR